LIALAARCASFYASRDLLAMARAGLRDKLRAAIQQAGRERARTVVTGAQTSYAGSAAAVRIEVHPVRAPRSPVLSAPTSPMPCR
jgi:two-component system CheB/CheR fusion protein